MAMYDLDPVRNEWDQIRIVGVSAATGEIPSISIFRATRRAAANSPEGAADARNLENEAIKTIIYRNGYAALPPYADDMIESSLREYGVPPIRLIDRPFMEAALREHRSVRRPATEDLAAEPL